MEDKLYDITFVCSMLGTTSRTLRFYEEEKLISSTRVPGSSRRRYTVPQISRIKTVLNLRSLGLSVREIRELFLQNSDIISAVKEKKETIYALIAENYKTLNKLDDLLSSIENADSYGDMTDLVPTDEDESSARICARAIIENDADTLYGYFDDKVKSHLLVETFRKKRAEMIKFLGSYVRIEREERDENYPTVIYEYVRYEKMGVRIKFVFHNGKICGLWLQYCEI